MATGKPPVRIARHEKLGRTILDLETALADWDSLTSEVTPDASTEDKTPVAKAPPESELRKKTKMLLDQLKEQLAELDD